MSIEGEKEYLKEVIDPIFSELLTQLLLLKPDNIVSQKISTHIFLS